MILSFPARAAALLIAATCASPALAQVTIHPDDTVIQGDLTVQVPSTGAGNPIEGSLYVEDDSTIDASLCLGNSCSTSESFANEVTLRFRYTENAIEVYVGRLRKRIGPLGLRIETVRGLGYRLETAPA